MQKVFCGGGKINVLELTILVAVFFRTYPTTLAVCVCVIMV